MSETYNETLPAFDWLSEVSRKKIDKVVKKVLDVLEKREDLKEQFKNDFREMYLGALSNPVLLDKLLDGIETRMIDALRTIEEGFKSWKLDSIQATVESKNIIKKYTVEELKVLKDSLAFDKKIVELSKKPD
jgi:hypothetical protein